MKKSPRQGWGCTKTLISNRNSSKHQIIWFWRSAAEAAACKLYSLLLVNMTYSTGYELHLVVMTLKLKASGFLNVCRGHKAKRIPVQDPSS